MQSLKEVKTARFQPVENSEDTVELHVLGILLRKAESICFQGCNIIWAGKRDFVKRTRKWTFKIEPIGLQN